MKNKTIIITGANGNLGQVALKTFLELGANVVTVSRGPCKQEIEGRVHFVENCDLSFYENAERVLAQTIKTFGGPDLLLNIAGGFIWKEIQDTSFEDIELQFNSNFKTMYNMVNCVLPSLGKRENARIINIGAMGALKAEAGMTAYAISKSAVMRFTEALAAESTDHITVNALLPSIIDTPQNRADMADADHAKWVTSQEIVDQMAFLASNEASGINGALIPMAGRM